MVTKAWTHFARNLNYIKKPKDGLSMGKIEFLSELRPRSIDILDAISYACPYVNDLGKDFIDEALDEEEKICYLKSQIRHWKI